MVRKSVASIVAKSIGKQAERPFGGCVRIKEFKGACRRISGIGKLGIVCFLSPFVQSLKLLVWQINFTANFNNRRCISVIYT